MLSLAREAAEARLLLTEEDILASGQLRHQIKLLVDDPDASIAAIDRAVDLPHLTIKCKRSLIRKMSATKHLDERALASAVFSHQCQHLARMQGQIHTPQRFHAGEGFGDALHRQERCCHGGLHRCGFYFAASAAASAWR